MRLIRLLALCGFLTAASGAVPVAAQAPSTPDSTAVAQPQSPAAPAAAPASPPGATDTGTSASTGASADTGAPAATTDADNPYGLQALWAGGDVVARATLAILAVMSVATWYVMITKFIQQAGLAGQGRSAQKKFWTAASAEEGATRLGKGSVYRFIANSGLAAANHHEGTLVQKVDASTWITLSLDRATTAVNSRLQAGLAVLATVGSIAPFVGLFGTVWGIYHALTAIGIAGQASIDKVAGPVGEALIMTAIGLATAVPAVLGYNLLIRRNKAVMENVRGFTADLYALLLSGRRIGDAPAASMKPSIRAVGE